MDDRVAQVAGMLEEAEHVHAVVSRRTGGVDPDWALFYAWWLSRWSDLPEALGASPGLADLTVELTRLDRAFRDRPAAGAPAEPWPAFYARELLTRPWA
jgi:hypothetical protein